MAEYRVQIIELLASPVHRYEGRPADGAAPAPDRELVERIELRAGLGIVGDRYFNQAAHRDSSVTLMSQEALDAVAREIGAPTPGLAQTCRNILLRGVDVDALAGVGFSLDNGEGPVGFQAPGVAWPCVWMNTEVGPGALRAFRGRSGLRTAPTSDGVLRLGPALLRTDG